MMSSSPSSFFALGIKVQVIIVTSQEFGDLFRKVALPAPNPWLYYEQECNNISQSQLNYMKITISSWLSGQPYSKPCFPLLLFSKFT